MIFDIGNTKYKLKESNTSDGKTSIVLREQKLTSEDSRPKIISFTKAQKTAFQVSDPNEKFKTEIIDGNSIANMLRQELKNEIEVMTRQYRTHPRPCLGILSCGENQLNKIYLRQMKKA